MNIRKRALGLALGALLVSAVGAVGFMTTSVPVIYFGPWSNSQLAFDSLTGSQTGGIVKTSLAFDSLEVGDYVYDTLINKVARSATLLSYNTAAGVVVGGARTSMRPVVASADVGTLAATANQRVLVAHCGRVWVRSADSVYAGITLIPGAVRGRLKRRTTAIDTFGRAAGRAVIAKDSGQIIAVDLLCRLVVGCQYLHIVNAGSHPNQESDNAKCTE
jgi:hypothetical protein